MKTLVRFAAACAALSLAFAPVQAAAATAPAKKKVLFFTKSSGFQHDAIKLQMPDGREGYAYPAVRAIGEKNNLEITVSKDGSLFTPEYLAQFDAFLFYTSGDLTLPKSDPRGDGLAPMTPAGKAAFLKAVADGKGLVALHSASDSFHSFGRNNHVPERFLSDGDGADDYIKMLGGEFIRHGKQQVARLTLVDPKFPGAKAFPAEGIMEEWYSLKNFPSDLHVILVQETKGMEGAEYERAAYPSTWARMHGKGRVFYSSLGHREDVWANPAFQSLLTGALDWAVGRVKADVRPNLTSVAPEANVMPKYVAPPPPAPKKDAPKAEKK
jgi:uncharacterized protein